MNSIVLTVIGHLLIHDNNESTAGAEDMKLPSLAT